MWLHGALADLVLILEYRLVRFGVFRASSGRERTRELLGLPSPATARVTANNQMKFGALMAEKEMGLSIQPNVTVIGFDDPEWAPLTAPPLTTLAQPTYEMGVEAAKLLLDRIEGGRD